MSRQHEFDEFVLTRSPRLLRTAYLLTRDWASAEDLLQTALAKAWFAWPRMNGDPEPYVRRILANTYASWWRRRWNGEHPTADLPERPPHLTEPQAAVDARDELWRSLGRLPKRQRLVLVLRYFEDLSERETAEIMHCSVGTIKSQTAKALAKLRLDKTLGVYA
ncbi:SigE family RNA polymerase sigma factor [Luedemannella flava]|uniref:SigE family RNA polymerase sigma factor n=1 Tax=Luedemannella flava TaxID=349316 RepID=A0ABP4YJB4_9ACTN